MTRTTISSNRKELEDPNIQKRKKKVEEFKFKIENEVCLNFLKAFQNSRKHDIKLTYEKDFNEKDIPTKARPIQTNQELMEYCKKEIQELLDKGKSRKMKSSWICFSFYIF